MQVGLSSAFGFILGVGLLTAASVSAQTPEKGGTLTVTYGVEQRALSPAIQAAMGVYQIGAKIQEPLIDLAYDEAGGIKLNPVLATSWSSSADGRTITVNLREGVKWHDGKDFTSADVAYSALNVWKAVQNYGNVLFANLEAVDTPDDHTAVFRFSEPMPLDLFTFAMPDLGTPVPRHVYEGTDVRANPANLAPVGTGPFVFDEYRRGQYVLLKRNPDYWQEGRPYLDGIQFRILGNDRAAAANSVEAGVSHMSLNNQISLLDTRRLSNVPGLEVSDKGFEGATWIATLEFNMRRPELNDVRVRQAIHHAVDVDFLVQNVFLGYGRAATGPIPSVDQRFYTGDVDTYAFDAEKAGALLDEAGYPKDANGVRFQLRLMPAPWFEFYAKMAEVLKQQLEMVGIEVVLENADGPGYLARVYREHDFDLSIGSNAYRNDPAISTTPLYRSGVAAGIPWSNQYGWVNEQNDDLLDRASVEVDPEKRAQLYREWQELVAREVPILMLVEHGFVSAMSTKVQNRTNTPRWSSSGWADTWLSKD